jgi:hypothetical protein
MTGGSQEERGLKASGGQCQQPRAVLRDINYAGIPQVSRKFEPWTNYIIFIVTIPFLPHSFRRKIQGFEMSREEALVSPSSL